MKTITSHEETPGSSVAGRDWLPPLPKATPILTSGVDTNEYRIAFPSRIGIIRSCKTEVLTLFLSQNNNFKVMKNYTNKMQYFQKFSKLKYVTNI